MAIAISTVMLFSCKDGNKANPDAEVAKVETADFNYLVEQFADIKVLRYQIPSWDDLTLKEQKLVYYLTQAGLEGRDIMWDQNYRHNLLLERLLKMCIPNTQVIKHHPTGRTLRFI